ncbi:MAG: hypothetical protein ACKVX9_20135 [Blastocatellia bacterium]
MPPSKTWGLLGVVNHPLESARFDEQFIPAVASDLFTDLQLFFDDIPGNQFAGDCRSRHDLLHGREEVVR